MMKGKTIGLNENKKNKMKYLFFSILMIALFIQCSPKINFSNMENNPLYGLHGNLVAKEGKGKELSNILLDASALMKSAKGCHLYAVSIDNRNPNEVWITEIWESKEDHDNSLNVPGVKELIGKAIPILERNPQKGQELEILGGLGIK